MNKKHKDFFLVTSQLLHNVYYFHKNDEKYTELMQFSICISVVETSCAAEKQQNNLTEALL